MTNEITPERIAELRRLHLAATRAPWTRQKPTRDADGWAEGTAVAGTPGRQTIYANPPGGSFPSADCDVIVAARNALPDLLDEIERLRALESKMGSGWALVEADKLQQENEKLRALLPKAFDAGWGEGFLTERRGYPEDYLRYNKRDDWVANALKEKP